MHDEMVGLRKTSIRQSVDLLDRNREYYPNALGKYEAVGTGRTLRKEKGYDPGGGT